MPVFSKGLGKIASPAPQKLSDTLDVGCSFNTTSSKTWSEDVVDDQDSSTTDMRVTRTFLIWCDRFAHQRSATSQPMNDYVVRRNTVASFKTLC